MTELAFRYDWQVWWLFIFGSIVVISSALLVTRKIALEALPEHPTRLDRWRHALWNYL